MSPAVTEEMSLCLFSPTLPRTLAAQRAEDMRIAVGHAEIQYEGRLLKKMTLSFGIATFPADARTSNELLRVADTALFCAKSEGRDRVRVNGQASAPTTWN